MSGEAAPTARVVIIGGGFGGLACARQLGRAPCAVTLIDRRNHNLFQPLLYQVATAALSPADIAEPLRRILRRYSNIAVVLGDVIAVEPQSRVVRLATGQQFPFDFLVIATGSDYNYFGHDEWAEIAPGLKTLNQARQIRQGLLLSLERAELCADARERQALLTSVVVGGGPTGVEMAGEIAELGRRMIQREGRTISSQERRTSLGAAGPRILNTFPEHLADYAVQRLHRLGVEVRTGAAVKNIEPGRVTVGDEVIEAANVVWGAGIKAAAGAGWIGAETGVSGRMTVTPELRVSGFQNIFALGDVAAPIGRGGKPLPALAQVAKQQGEHLGRALASLITSGKPVPAFRFRNRGNTAVIGRNAAVFDFGTWTLKGWPAWMLWALVHVYLLISFEKRLLVSVQWAWGYITRQGSARIISEASPPGMASGCRPERKPAADIPSAERNESGLA